MTRE
ncbi:1333d4c9-9ebc-4c08-8c37-65dd6b955065 [Thermothielavioides terrestris]|jgi:hypothetical protein